MSTEEADLLAVVARRRRVATVLTIVIVAAYFGFIALVAFAKPTAGALLSDGRASVGIVLGAAVIVLCPILTAVYVWWANRHYDPAVRALRDSKKP